MLSKKLAMVAMVSSFGLATAHAADAPNYKSAPIPVAPIAIEVPTEHSWDGFHFGLSGGGIKLHSYKDVDAVSIKEFGKLNYPIAGIGGVQAGYDHQFGRFVLGLEGDANFFSGPVLTVKSGDVKANVSVNRMFTARARAGYAVDRTLFYVTGGWANIDLKAKASNNQAKVKVGTKARDGWTVGGGLEYALTDNLSARGEYLYVSIPGEKTVDKVDGEKFKGPRDKFSVVRVGLNYKF
jgi:outer membrane immunogenic protein